MLINLERSLNKNIILNSLSFPKQISDNYNWKKISDQFLVLYLFRFIISVILSFFMKIKKII